MALDETTRQVNRRAIAALEAAKKGLGDAANELRVACWPLEDLSQVTNAHDPALEEMHAVLARVRAAREDVARRWLAESEGE
ncbi:hypothetical protein C8K30_110112 [Promicromonospora sp. AC04]|uniref:hypothetical protein n=1 Tax=Promicromonospora sp. AC04 TaxID=2135723 RepID=UPI000D39982C|nr:hypothetical protein [Promicromonospora sp. AC04]PUB23969.1 hypothetical protein C8K30_110112 [Promicromonospora sp. AC04]